MSGERDRPGALAGGIFWPWRLRLRVAWKRGLRLWHRGTIGGGHQQARGLMAVGALRPCPQKIWMYWHQGWERAPLLSRLALCRWAQAHPDWRVIALDRATVEQSGVVPADVANREMGLAHRADVVRVAILARYGGVWADATTIPAAPLGSWLPRALAGGMFAYSWPGPDRRVSNWFLASVAGGSLMQAWRDLTFAYWRRIGKALCYHWQHYLFDEAVVASPATRGAYEAMPKIANSLANAVQFHALDGARLAAFRPAIEDGLVPLHKLSSKLAIPPRFAGTPLALLLGCDSIAAMEQAVAQGAHHLAAGIAEASLFAKDAAAGRTQWAAC